MINTANEFGPTCWYQNGKDSQKEKALLLDISNGYATLLLESGRFTTCRVESLILNDIDNIFEQYEWCD